MLKLEQQGLPRAANYSMFKLKFCGRSIVRKKTFDEHVCCAQSYSIKPSKVTNDITPDNAWTQNSTKVNLRILCLFHCETFGLFEESFWHRLATFAIKNKVGI